MCSSGIIFDFPSSCLIASAGVAFQLTLTAITVRHVLDWSVG